MGGVGGSDSTRRARRRLGRRLGRGVRQPPKKKRGPIKERLPLGAPKVTDQLHFLLLLLDGELIGDLLPGGIAGEGVLSLVLADAKPCTEAAGRLAGADHPIRPDPTLEGVAPGMEEHRHPVGGKTHSLHGLRRRLRGRDGLDHQHGNPLLLPLLVLPMTAPILIFGVAAADAAVTGLSPRPHLLLLCALLLAALPLCPLAAGLALRGASE